MTVEEPSSEPEAHGADPPESQTPTARFAAELRGLRAHAGSPSYRQLARVMHYSPSTIVDATTGRRLPTEQVVRALATACNADPDLWADKLHEAARATADAAHNASSATNASNANNSAIETPPTAHDVTQSDSTRAAPTANRRDKAVRWTAGTALACALLAAGYVVGSVTHSGSSTTPSSKAATGTTSPRPTPAFSYPALDGADPIAAGCTGDAQLLDKTALMRDGAQVGAVELKYSVRCHAGWARVYLYPTSAPRLTGILASVEVIAQDGTAELIAARLHMDVPNYTDVVQPHGGCLRAVAVLGPDTTTPDNAAIGCDAPPTAEPH